MVCHQTQRGSQRCFSSCLLHLSSRRVCTFSGEKGFITNGLLFWSPLSHLSVSICFSSTPIPLLTALVSPLRGKRSSISPSFLPPLHLSIACHQSLLTSRLGGSVPLWIQLHGHVSWAVPETPTRISPLVWFNALLLLYVWLILFHLVEGNSKWILTGNS